MKKLFSDAIFLCGFIFSSIGGLFFILGIVFAINYESLKNSPNSSGEVIMFPIIFTGMGGLFLIIGLSFVISRLKRFNRQKKVRENGYYIMATVANFYENTSVSFNGVHPFVLECQYEDLATGILHIFTSQDLFFYPQDVLDKDVRVFVDRANFENYYVDTESLFGVVQRHK